jgi:hypothetical protein
LPSISKIKKDGARWTNGFTRKRILSIAKEFATPQVNSLHFFAMTDLPFDQTTQYRPCGRANTLQEALSECLINCRKHTCEPATTAAPD